MMRTQQTLFGILVACALSCAALLTPVRAADMPAASPQAVAAPIPAVERMADRVLREATDLLKNAQGFKITTNVIFDEVLRSGLTVQYSRYSSVTVQRPDRIFAQVTDDLGERQLWFDGSTMTVFRPDRMLYAKANVTGSIDDAIDTLHDKYGLAVPFADILVNDPYANFTEGLYAGFYAGLNLVNRERAHHLVFTNDAVDFQLWVAEKGKPVLKRVVITFKNQEGSPQWAADFLSWDFDIPTPDHTFQFTPPAGAEQIEFLSRASTGEDQQ
jgi:hypothetical protein